MNNNSIKKCFVLVPLMFCLLSLTKGQNAEKALIEGSINNLTASFSSYNEIQKLIIAGKANMIWSEDFDGKIPDSWMVVDNNNFCTFKHTDEEPQGQFSGGVGTLQSTTYENGFVIIDSDLCNTPKDEESYQLVDAYLQSPEIDLSDRQDVVLIFEHAFRYLGQNNGSPLQVLVSNNGEDWVSYDVTNNVPSNHISPNPVIKTINISDVAGGEESVMIRFHKSGTSHYYWMIDDIGIVGFAESDLSFESVNFGGYSLIPGGQQQPIDLSASLFNNGEVVLNNVQISVDINNYFFNESSDIIDAIEPGDTEEIFINKSFLPEVKGKYEMVFSFAQELFEDDLGLYLNKSSLWITDTVYSRDDNSYTEIISAENGDSFRTGNVFKVVSDVDATSIGAVLHHDTEPGAEIKGVIFEISDNDEIEFSKLTETSAYTVNDSDIPVYYRSNPVDVVLSFSEPFELEQGKSYLIAVEYTGNDNNAAIAGSKGINQPGTTSFSYVDNEWINETITPLVRLNLGNNKADCEVLLELKSTDASCGQDNGSVSVYPLTGTPPFNYKWNTDPARYTREITNLQEGGYQVTVTDDQGCQAVGSVEIEYLGGTLPSVDYTIVEPVGCGGSDGSIEIDPADDYTYNWSTGDTEKNLADIPAGEYRVTITEGDCHLNYTFYVNDEDAKDVEAEVSDANCFGYSDGRISINEDVFDEPVYLWSTGATDRTIQNLKAGNYAVTVTDNDCMSFEAFTVNEPDKLTIEFASVEHPSCYGYDDGRVLADVNGGTDPYNYFWNTGSTKDSIVNLKAGDYTLTVSDVNNCKEVSPVSLIGPEPIVIFVDTIIEPTGTENNGSIKIIVSGRQEDELSFQWSHGPKTKNVTGLPAGNYTVTVFDTAGCSVNKSFSIGEVWVSDIIAADVVSLYPNPAKDYAFLEFGIELGEVDLFVRDVFGRLIIKKKVNFENEKGTYRLDTSVLKPGAYIIVVRTDKEEIPLRLVVD